MYTLCLLNALLYARSLSSLTNYWDCENISTTSYYLYYRHFNDFMYQCT